MALRRSSKSSGHEELWGFENLIGVYFWVDPVITMSLQALGNLKYSARSHWFS